MVLHEKVESELAPFMWGGNHSIFGYMWYCATPQRRSFGTLHVRTKLVYLPTQGMVKSRDSVTRFVPAAMTRFTTSF